jgi:hypothetical protein
MYSLLHKMGLHQFLRREAFPFTTSLIIAELLYKFGSFNLDASAFIITWYIIGGILSHVVSKKANNFF